MMQKAPGVASGRSLFRLSIILFSELEIGLGVIADGTYFRGLGASIAPTPRNFSASSGKPSSSASLAMRSYISVHSKFSPSAACSRFSSVLPSSPSSLNHSLACSFSFSAVFRKIEEICS